ncbi:MAG TPA: cell division protein ZapA [Candidatus Avimonas sp.]|jgi:cell division protein ZapA|nr:cell division protein ZapA [Clostridiales bacterium]HOB35875.1 cell division protein ZapA [Candidatus Avimonas sp.]HQA15393.1 cell division protein ZapA [Candidatus Avimonas sp.]HQD37353.1 cell division protein ZapA [Candidatus Avimonas sp.]
MAYKNRVKLTICDTDYIISTDEPESYVKELGEELDRSMRNVMEGNNRISTTMAAVLSALTYADEARKAVSTADNLRSQLKDYLTDNSRLLAELEEIRRENERLLREIEELKSFR